MSDSNDPMLIPAPSQVMPPRSGEGSEGWEATVNRDILVGQRVGEYMVRRRIGSGGMGVVYEGEHPVIGRKVAIKLIRPDSSEGIRSRDLASEARATSTIRHRGIIDIFGFGTLPGVGQYLIMEYLSGRPLDEILAERAPMPLPEAIRLISELLEALSAAHGTGVIHRDLKPGNIFVVLESNGTEYLKVLDFGLAKQAETPHASTPQTRASMIVGTPEYMAPEQACGQAVSPRTDLYAVGIILFEMLTGRLPFQGATPMHIAIQQVQAQPPAPSSFVDGLPPELDELVLRLLAKEPEQRPVSAEAVLRELERLARALAVEMTRLSGLARPSSASVASVRPSSATQTGDAVASTVARARPSAANTDRLPGLEPRPVASPAPARPWRWVGLGLTAILLSAGAGLVASRGLRQADVVPATPPVPAPVLPELPPVVATAPPQEVAPRPAVPEPTPPPPEPESVREPEPEPEPRASANGLGRLQVLSKCWSDVYVDGVLRGRAPMRSIPLRKGVHLLEFKSNPGVEEHRARILIREGRELEFRAPCRSRE